MFLLHGDIEAGEQSQSFRSNSSEDHPPVLRFAGPRDKAAPLQSIQKSSNVRVASDHSIRNFPTSKAFPGAAEDSQDVVLRRREIRRL
jgi:hypothetical protein